MSHEYDMIADAKVIAFLIKLSIFLLVKVHHTNLCVTKNCAKINVRYSSYLES